MTAADRALLLAQGPPVVSRQIVGETEAAVAAALRVGECPEDSGGAEPDTRSNQAGAMGEDGTAA